MRSKENMNKDFQPFVKRLSILTQNSLLLPIKMFRQISEDGQTADTNLKSQVGSLPEQFILGRLVLPLFCVLEVE